MTEELEKALIVYLSLGSTDHQGMYLSAGFDAILGHRMYMAATEKTGSAAEELLSEAEERRK